MGVSRIDAPVTGKRIVDGCDRLGLLLLEAPAVDAILFVVFRPLLCGGLLLFPVRVINWTPLVIAFRHGPGLLWLVSFSSRVMSTRLQTYQIFWSPCLWDRVSWACEWRVNGRLVSREFATVSVHHLVERDINQSCSNQQSSRTAALFKMRSISPRSDVSDGIGTVRTRWLAIVICNC